MAKVVLCALLFTARVVRVRVTFVAVWLRLFLCVVLFTTHAVRVSVMFVAV